MMMSRLIIHFLDEREARQIEHWILWRCKNLFEHLGHVSNCLQRGHKLSQSYDSSLYDFCLLSVMMKVWTRLGNGHALDKVKNCNTDNRVPFLLEQCFSGAVTSVQNSWLSVIHMCLIWFRSGSLPGNGYILPREELVHDPVCAGG